MIRILLRTLWDKRYTLSAYYVGELCMVWLYVGLYPTIGMMSDSYETILASFPPQVLEAFGFSGGFSGFESYLAAEHYGIIWPIVLIPFIASLTGGVVTKEIETGTMEILLSMPISRLRIFFAKYFAGIVGLLLFICFSSLTVIPFAYAYQITFSALHIYSMTLLALLFGLAVHGMGIFFATIFSDRSKAYALLGGLLVAMYFVKIIALLSDRFVYLKYVSLFYYFNVSDAITRNHISWEAYAIFLSIFGVTTLAAAIVFTRRDIAI